MELRQILKALILPPGINVLLLFLVLACWRWRKAAVALLIMGLGYSYLLSTPLLAHFLAEKIEVYPALAPDALAIEGVDAIVVLGGGVENLAQEYGGPSLSASSLERVRYGAFLAKHTRLPLFMSGGSPFLQYLAVGKVMADVASQEFGVEQVDYEIDSRTTWENALFSKQYVLGGHAQRIYLVTNAWHMLRSVESFEAVGFEVLPAPTRLYKSEPIGWYTSWLPDRGAYEYSSTVMHELVGLFWYRQRYF